MARRIGMLPGVLDQHFKAFHHAGSNRRCILALQHPVDDLAINCSAQKAQCRLQGFQTNLQLVTYPLGARFGKKQERDR